MAVANPALLAQVMGELKGGGYRQVKERGEVPSADVAMETVAREEGDAAGEVGSIARQRGDSDIEGWVRILKRGEDLQAGGSRWRQSSSGRPLPRDVRVSLTTPKASGIVPGVISDEGGDRGDKDWLTEKVMQCSRMTGMSVDNCPGGWNDVVEFTKSRNKRK